MFVVFVSLLFLWVGRVLDVMDNEKTMNGWNAYTCT